MHMAMAIMEMHPQMEVERDIFNPLFLRAAAGVVKNIPSAPHRTSRRKSR